VDMVDEKLNTTVDITVNNVRKDMDECMMAFEKKVKATVEDAADVERRKYNIVILGVKESEEETEDDEVVTGILGSGLHVDPVRNVDNVMRIGRKTKGRHRAIRVKIKSIDSKNEIMKGAKELKECEKFKGVYIQPDLSLAQQKTDKELWDEVKRLRNAGETDVEIKAGKVVKTCPMVRYEFCTS